MGNRVVTTASGVVGPPFAWYVTSLEGSRRLSFTGELDIATAPVAIEAIGSCVDGQAEPVLVIDLAALSFIDCSGVRVLVLAKKALEVRGGELRILLPETGVVPRVLGLLDDYLDLPYETAA